MTKTKITYTIFALAALLAAFYWYELRPRSIRQDCVRRAGVGSDTLTVIGTDKFGDTLYLQPSERDKAYRTCLQEHGLTK